MALVKKPPRTTERRIHLEEPVSRLLDDYCRFVDCTPDYVNNFALKKPLGRDTEYTRWKASQPAASTVKETAASSHAARTV